MTEHIFEGYGAISALSTVAFLFWGWAHHRAHHPRAIESSKQVSRNRTDCLRT